MTQADSWITHPYTFHEYLFCFVQNGATSQTDFWETRPIVDFRILENASKAEDLGHNGAMNQTDFWKDLAIVELRILEGN